MPVYKDEARGTWYFVARIKTKNGNTKQIKRRGFAKKKEAKEAEQKAKNEAENTSDVTFAEVCNSYFDWYVLRRKQSSINVIKNIIFNHLMDEFGHRKIDKITPAHVVAFQNKIIQEYSPDFLKKIHTTLSAIFNYSIRTYGSKKNPAKIAGNFDVKKKKRINYWEYDEYKKFIEEVEESLYEAFFETLYYSGARKGELLALTWDDVDFEEGSIDINKTEYNRQVTEPKTEESIRKIMMPGFVLNKL